MGDLLALPATDWDHEPVRIRTSARSEEWGGRVLAKKVFPRVKEDQVGGRLPGHNRRMIGTVVASSTAAQMR